METIRTDSLNEAMAQVGLAIPPGLDVQAGAIRRFDDPEGSKGNKAAWVRPFPDGLGAVFGNWRTDQSYTWQKIRDRAMSKAETQVFRQQIEASRKEAESAREADYNAAAEKALRQWEAASPATDAPYLRHKVIQPHGTRQQGQSLLVPVLDAQGAIQSLQTIQPDGSKRFLSGGRMAGGRFWIGEPGPVIVIAEGFATASAIHEAAHVPVVVAFNAGNLLRVAQDVCKAYPKAHIILAGDEDIHPERENVGRLKATAAARAVDGKALFPKLDGKACDWWDVRHEQGDEPILMAFNPPPRYKLLSASDVEQLAPIEWCIKGVLPAHGLAQVYGASRSGKSFLVLDMACAVAGGRTWFGYRVNRAPVVYVALEGEAGFRLRAQAWSTHSGQSLPDGLHMVMQPFRIDVQQDVLDLAAVIPAGAVTVIDTQNRAAPTADENSSEDMGAILLGAKLIADATRGLVILVTHTGKDDTRGARGHSSQLAAMDAALYVRRNGEARTWSVDKAKDAADGGEHGFVLDVVNLGIDADGDPLTSCVVVESDGVPRAALPNIPKGGNVRVVWEKLGDMLCAAGDVRPSDAPKELPEGRPTVRLDDAIAKIGPSLPVEQRRRAERTRAAILSLVNKGLVDHQGGWLWIK